MFVGEDLDVLLELCDRILVLCGGKVCGIVDARTATKEEIGLLMTKVWTGGNQHERKIRTQAPALPPDRRDACPPAGVVHPRRRPSCSPLIVWAACCCSPSAITPLNRLRHDHRRLARVEDRPSARPSRSPFPLLGCALAIAPCFKMHFWNIGAEGQITAGAIGGDASLR